MAMLAGTFAATAFVVTYAVDVSKAGEGYKTSLVVADYSVLVYLFFFNGWFRNKVIGHVMARHRE
jgi:hypothetical protein